MSGEDDVGAEVPVAVTAGPAPLARYRRIDRDPFPAPRAVRDHARTLVPRHQRPGELGVADAAFGVPVQVRAADANRGNPHEALASGCFGHRLLPDPQIRSPVKSRRSHAPHTIPEDHAEHWPIAHGRRSLKTHVSWVLRIGEGVELGEVVDVLGAVLVPEIMEAALLAR